MLIDFTEIPMPGSGRRRDDFELFTGEFLSKVLRFHVRRGPSRGQDGGCDLLASQELVGAREMTVTITWLVSCKHNAHSGRSVSVADELDIRDRLNTHRCDGFLGFYSTAISGGLDKKLQALRETHNVLVLNHRDIEAELLKSPAGRTLAHRYFPRSVAPDSPPFLRDRSVSSPLRHEIPASRLRDVFIAGPTLQVILTEQQLLRELVERGCAVRLLIPNPDSSSPAMLGLKAHWHFGRQHYGV